MDWLDTANLALSVVGVLVSVFALGYVLGSKS
jgi:hypothetical protein